ncbi:hypothetical protein FOXG_18295 [Fusarium oxysporum f. sp. lycopersici 4287]|uniref:Uncharacterized protein n=2 Tax=Fusarium oxysporum TaxID=5507 RepID=A0A0J9WI27_FUSO4|nr:hypothetical protein FOXG_18295 [Fusarium oxysporum f. sp. lycopersici 4287]EXK41187.1 hypothetical protein FOMG_04686 [Fusarium oxysporum f. sp. melonis 26406]KNA97801.1 hypothetical protein FOXG_18295 [Fusarium oxysporum f. sp. lycopersici 4287]
MNINKRIRHLTTSTTFIWTTDILSNPVRFVGRFSGYSGVKRDLGICRLYTKITLLPLPKSGTVVSVLDPKIINLKSLKSAPTIPPSPTVPLFVFAGWHNFSMAAR